MSIQTLCLRGLRGSIEDKCWQSKRRLRVGRVQNFEVALDDPSVSRQHAELVFTPQGWCVHDLESTNGTYLNGVRVGRAEMKVRERDIIQFGETGLVVDWIRAESEQSSPLQDESVEIQHTVAHTVEEIPALLKSIAASGRTDMLNALVHLGRDFHNHSDLGTYLRAALWEIVAVLDCQLGAISMLDEFTDTLRLRTVFNMGVSSSHDGWVVPEIAARVLRRNESVICRRGDEDLKKQSEMFVVIRSPRKVLGVLQLVRAADEPPFAESELIFAEALCFSVSTSIESLDHLWRKEHAVIVSTLTALTQLTHLRDDWTGGQTKRATDYALILGECLGVTDTDRHCLQIGTPLRDLGRLGLPDRILNKPGPLTPEEAYVVKTHVSKGVALLESVAPLVPIIPIVRSHHERWDGNGYPDGLAGDQIPLVARIVAVADAFDALTTARPYRAARSVDEAFWEIKTKAGSQFDPTCVDALVRCREDIENLFHERELLSDTVVSEGLAQTGKLRRRIG